MSKPKPQWNFSTSCSRSGDFFLLCSVRFSLCFNRIDLFTLPFVLKKQKLNATMEATEPWQSREKKTKRRIMHIWWIKYFICADGTYIVSGMNFAFSEWPVMNLIEFVGFTSSERKRRWPGKTPKSSLLHHHCTIQSNATRSIHPNAKSTHSKKRNTSTKYAMHSCPLA